MKIIKKQYLSPSIPNKLRSLIIIEPENISDQSPVCFFYDGHVLKTNNLHFNNPQGIEITKLMPNAIIIALATIDDHEKNKWDIRKKQLLDQKNNQYTWNLLVKEIVNKYRKKYLGKWFGFGFSLSGFLVLENHHLFDQVIAISPYLKDFLTSKNLKGDIYYGTKEYLKNADTLINKPIQKLAKQNLQLKITKIPQMVHDFPSWTKYFPQILQKSLPFFRNGYLNFVQEQDKQYIRVSPKQFSNWNNELLIFKALKIDYQVEQNILKRKWFKGQIVDKWTPERLNNLKKEIEKLHNLKIKNLTKHNWLKYQNHKKHLLKDDWEKYLLITNKYKNDPLVVSHNDLNKQNILINQEKIRLIDYEWANLNHQYFDYIQFYIAENIRIEKLPTAIFNEWVFICLIYFILWSYEMPQNKQVLNWRKEYLNKLKKY